MRHEVPCKIRDEYRLLPMFVDMLPAMLCRVIIDTVDEERLNGQISTPLARVYARTLEGDVVTSALLR